MLSQHLYRINFKHKDYIFQSQKQQLFASSAFFRSLLLPPHHPLGWFYFERQQQPLSRLHKHLIMNSDISCLTAVRKFPSNLAFLIWQVIKRAYLSLTNGRSLIGLVANFSKNFSIIFSWLLIFKNAGLIPTDIRPEIHVSILHLTDAFLFEGVSGFFCFLVMTSLIWLVAYFLSNDTNVLYDSYVNDERNSSGLFDNESRNDSKNSSSSLYNIAAKEDDGDEDDAQSVNSSSSGSVSTYMSEHLPIIKAASRENLIKVSAVSLIWVYLNLEKLATHELSTPLDIMAWTSYVILHLAAPIITACYLWLFAPAGVCGTFGLALGTQNILGVSTHLLFPTAPPWYYHKYGDQPGTYEMPGYAAGLTRVDIALGTHIHSKGFHKSPIVFGAFPSLHGAFVSLIFLFVVRYARWGFRKLSAGALITAIYASWQWWATMYLDHHWRLDLLGGASYALLAYLIFLPRLRRFEASFVNGDSPTTGGMRLFANTCFENWFNPSRHIRLLNFSRRHFRYSPAADDSTVTLALDDFDI